MGNGTPVLRDEDVAALSETSGLEPVQVREAFNGFIEEHPKGRMKPKDFNEMMTKAMPKKDASKMQKHVFRIYDSNNDGYIDFIEFMLIYHIMSDGTPEEVLGKIFRVFDVNGDGHITKKEMTRLVKDMYGLIKAEDPESKSEALIAKSAFTEMDADGDGKITTENSSTHVSLKTNSAKCWLSRSSTSLLKRSEECVVYVLIYYVLSLFLHLIHILYSKVSIYAYCHFDIQ